MHEWVFANETIETNIDLVQDGNIIYLYTKANVKPLNENTIRISKTAINETDANAEYGFTLKLFANVETLSDPLTGEAAKKLHGYNSAAIQAESELEIAQNALDKARAEFANSVFATTNSALSFVMYGDETTDIYGKPIAHPALYGVTTGSAYGSKNIICLKTVLM